MENTRLSNDCQAPLPDRGRYTAEQWASFLKLTPKALKEKMIAHGIRVIPFGSIKIVDAAWFWDDLLKSGGISREGD